jgi:hypothetical protein
VVLSQVLRQRADTRANRHFAGVLEELRWGVETADASALFRASRVAQARAKKSLTIEPTILVAKNADLTSENEKGLQRTRDAYAKLHAGAPPEQVHYEAEDNTSSAHLLDDVRACGVSA